MSDRETKSADQPHVAEGVAVDAAPTAPVEERSADPQAARPAGTGKMEALARFARRVLDAYSNDNGPQAAAMLTYTSLLSMVPLMAVGFGSLAAFPVFENLSADLQDFVFQNFVPAAGEAVQLHLSEFAAKASRMTAVGIVFLVLTALMLMSNIDKALNRIWRVAKHRSLLKSFLVYWAVLTLGPLLIGASLALTSYLVSLPFLAEADMELGIRAKLLGALPVLSAALAFSLLYLIVPNRRVRVLDALAGGIFAALLFEVAKRLFAWYVTAFPTYEAIYGALAAAPIFLIWVYLSWSVILLGAQVAYVRGLRGAVSLEGLTDGQQVFVGIYRMLCELCEAQGQGGGVSVDEEGSAGLDHAGRCLAMQKLEAAGLVARLADGGWVLSRGRDDLTLEHVYQASGQVLPDVSEFENSEHPWDRHLAALLGGSAETLATILKRPLQEGPLIDQSPD
ncbi:MAG: virulence factor BrkB family protein [Gammaproteobacteria bacterium]